MVTDASTNGKQNPRCLIKDKSSIKAIKHNTNGTNIKRYSSNRSYSTNCRLWPILTLISSLPCFVFLMLLSLVFIPPTPIALAAATHTEDPGSEATTYQSIEDTEDLIQSETLDLHNESILTDLLRTQTLLLEATQDVAKATKDMSVTMGSSTSTAGMDQLQENYLGLEEHITNLTADFDVAKQEVVLLTYEKTQLHQAQSQMADRIEKLETMIEILQTKLEQDRHVIKDENNYNAKEFNCPDKFEWVGVDCIHLGRSDLRSTWHEARGKCHDLGGDLAVPSNLTLLASRLRGETMPGVWVGATDNLGQGRWYWLVSGNNVNEDAWAPGHPKDDGEWTNCGALMRDHNYTMVEETCSFYNYYICQIFPKGFWQANLKH